MKSQISPHVVCERTANAGTHNPKRQLLKKTTTPALLSRGRGVSLRSQGRLAESANKIRSNLARNVFLYPVGHLHQPLPGLLQKAHHAIHVAIARQRNFYFALAIGGL